MGVPSRSARVRCTRPDENRTKLRTPTRTRRTKTGPRAALRLAGLSLTLSLAVACAPSRDVPAEAGPDEVLIGAVLRFQRGDAPHLLSVEQTRFLAPGDTLVAPVGDSAQVLSTWRFPRTAFLHPDGRPLTDDDYRGLMMRAAEQAPWPDHGRCGRCLAPAFDALPQVTHAGSSCAPPRDPDPRRPGAEDEDRIVLEFFGAGDLEDAAALAGVTRDQIRFEWPGDCACPLAEVARAPATPFELELADGVTDTIGHRVVTASPDGLIGLFDDREVRLLAADGATRAVARPRESYVAAAVSLSDTEHLIGVVRGGINFTHDWYSTGADLQEWRLLDIPQAQFDVNITRAVPERPRHFLMAGIRRTPAQAEVVLCSTAAELCATIIELGSFAPNEEFAGLFPLEDGGWMATTEEGTVVHIDSIPDVRAVTGQSVVTGPIRSRPDGTGASLDGMVRTGTVTVLRWRAMHVDVYALASGARLPAGDLRGATVVGDRFYMCVQAPGPVPADDRQLIVSRRFGRAGLDAPDPLDPQLGFETLACRAPLTSSCRALVTTGTVARAILNLGFTPQMLRFDRDGPLDPEEARTPGCQTATTPPTAPPYDLPVDFLHHLQVRPDAWLGVTARGDVASLEPGRPLRWVYGDGAPLDAWTSVVPEGPGGGTWLFGPRAVAGYLAPGSRTVELREAPLGQGVREAALDSSVAAPDRGFVVIDRLGRLGKLTLPAAGPPSLVPLTEEVGDVISPSQVVEVAPGTHVAIASRRNDPQDRQVWRIRGTTVEIADLPDDDPATAADELAYTQGGTCNLVRRDSENPYIGRGSAAPRGLTASHGIAWVVGCGGELHRVTAVGEPLRVERYAYTRAPGLVFPTNPPRPYDFTTAAALCPDHVLLAGPETTTNTTGASIRLWEIRPSNRPASGSREEADVRVLPLMNEPPQAVIDKGQALAIVPAGPTRSPWLVLSGSQDNILGTVAQMERVPPAFFSNAPQSAALAPDGRLVVTLEGGAVLVSGD